MAGSAVNNNARSTMLALVAAMALVTACGPSEQAQFDATLEAGQEALLVDDLIGAQLRFEDALRLRPGDDAALASLALVAEIKDSRDRFEEATKLLDRGRHLLEARTLFLDVSESDILRHGDALTNARAAEERWIDDAMSLLDQRLAGDDFSAVMLSISEFRRQLPQSELLEAALARSYETLIDSAARIAMLEIEAGDLLAAGRALSDAENALRVTAPAVAFAEIRQTIEREREREAERRAAERASQQTSRPGSPSPTPAQPTLPPRRNVDGCPAPSLTDRAWEECLNERALAETGCPSVIYDSDAWEECTFGGGGGTQQPPPAGSETPSAPKMMQIGESGVGNDGLTVTVTSILTSERPGSFVYTVSYRLENRTDEAVDEGSFKLYGPNNSLAQFGFFSRMFPTDVIERTAVFEEVKSQRFDLIAYHGDQFFAERPPQGSLAWSVPGP